MPANRTLTEISLSLENAGHNYDVRDISEALEFEGRPDGTNKTRITNKAFLCLLEEQDKKKAAKAPAVKTTSNAAPRKTSSNGQAQKVRAQRETARAPKPSKSILPKDNNTLRTLMEEITTARRASNWQAPEGWLPDKKSISTGSERGTVSYATPMGSVDNVLVSDYRLMRAGKMEWTTPEAKVDNRTKRRWAKSIKELSFQEKVCRLCGKPLDESEAPEWAQVGRLLRGIEVLPYIDWPLRKAQKEMRFRRMHLLHALLEDALAEIYVELDGATDDEIAQALIALVPEILAEAEKKRPSTYTEDDVMQAIIEVLEHWKEEEA